MLEYKCIWKKEVKITMKKKFCLILSLILALSLCAIAIFTVSATGEADPLISLSYLEKIVLPSFKEDILSEIKAMNFTGYDGDEDDEDVFAYADESNKPESTDEAFTESDKDIVTGNNSYTLLELTYGQVVTADGICEFISRPGSKITVVSPFPAQGIADITNGNEILDGEEIPINAYCLIPRGGDGRGFTVQSENAYIMIRGEYTIG